MRLPWLACAHGGGIVPWCIDGGMIVGAGGFWASRLSGVAAFRPIAAAANGGFRAEQLWWRNSSTARLFAAADLPSVDCVTFTRLAEQRFGSARDFRNTVDQQTQA
jgi:hypothetical protein